MVSKLAPEAEKNSDTRITVATSASEAPAITSCPNVVLVWPASRSTATTIPNEVAARMMATSTGVPASPAASKPKATRKASASETANAAPTVPRWRSPSASKAISSPARKNRNTSPTCENTSSGALTWTRSSSSGPIRMPARISVTSGGTLGIGSRSTSSGAAVAAARAITKSL